MADRMLPDTSHPKYWLFEAHYEALNDRRLVAQRCTQCSTIYWPPLERCRVCGGEQFEPIETATEGVVYTYTVMYDARGGVPGFELPYAVAFVDVAPGVRMIGNVFGDDLEHLRCGATATADFVRDGEVTFLVWHISTPASSS